MKALEVVGLVQHLVAFRIQIADLADVLFALRLGHSTVGPRDLSIVLDDLHRLEITLELEKVAHDPLRTLAKLSRAELVEVLKPNLLQMMLDLLRLLVTHDIGDELCVKDDVVVRVCGRDELIEELAEIVTDGQIDQHLLVERGVVLTINRLYVFELREVTKRIGLAHDFLDRSTVLL